MQPSATTAAVCLALALTAACGPPPDARPVTPRNVVMIVIDTLRADRLGVYGNTRGLTPYIDSLASRGYVFRHAYAQSSWTGASVASLFTSRYQSEHGIVSLRIGLADNELTLAEVLRTHGYATAAFSANITIPSQLGYAQGFATYETFGAVPGPSPRSVNIPVRAGALIQPALQWVDALAPGGAAAPPAFLYIQFMEPHVPYAPPPDALARVLGDRPAPEVDFLNGLMVIANVAAPSAEQARDLELLYDAEVVAIDQALAGLLDGLAALGVLENAVVVLTSDHGEGFGAHALFGHGGSLYDELIRVPLIVLVPAHSGRTDVDEVVQLIDVAPTLLELIGIPVPGTFEGRSFCGLLVGGPGCRSFAGLRQRLQRWWATDGRLAYSELFYARNEDTGKRHHERAVVVGSHKVVLASDGALEFYDLQRDPSEHDAHGLADAERARLEKVLRRTARAAPVRASEGGKPDEELQKKLHALGYAN